MILGINSKKDKPIQKTIYSSEIARAMTYAQVADGDEATNSEYVKFDAFFLRDLDGDGYAESLRGSCRKIGESDTLYMELNVITNGYLENGVITISGNNFYLQTSIPKDNEIKENAIGSVSQIKLNTINNGTQKLLTGKIYRSIGNNVTKYSSKNCVTLTGTHVANDGTRTEINKIVEFNIDWHGTTMAEMPAYIAQNRNLNQEQNIENAINEEEETFTIEHNIGMQEINNQLNIKKAYIETEIPELNGYAPISVEGIGTNVTYTYDETTRKFTMQREAIVNESGIITSQAYDGTYGGARYNRFKVRVIYPLEAYYSVGSDTVEVSMQVTGYYEGFNNENIEFTNPYKSNTAKNNFILTMRRFHQSGVISVAGINITVGKQLYIPTNRYIVSKDKPIRVYNGVSEPQDNDTYIVRWYGSTGGSDSESGMIMKETEDGKAQVSDQFVKTDGTSISMENVTTNVGIYFSNPTNMLGEDGWIKVYDDETDELLVMFTNNDWNKYDENKPYTYEVPVKHIMVETSNVNTNTGLTVYNVKRLDDEYITNNYTREEFDNIQYIKSTLAGYFGTKHISTAIHNANYEAPYTTLGVSVSKATLSTQETEKNMRLTIHAKADESINQEKWLNGTFLVKLPSGIIDAEISSVMANNGVTIMSYEQFEQDGINYIKINTENSTPTIFDIVIDCNLTPDPRIISKSEDLEVYAYNENGTRYLNQIKDSFDINYNLNKDEMIGKTSTSMSLVSPNSLLTSQTVTNYDNNGSIAVAPQIAVVAKERRTANIEIELKNNYSSTISEAVVLGRIPFSGNKYVMNKEELGSNFSTTMQNTGIIIPEELKEEVTVYYSENADATKDLSDSNNGWSTSPSDFSKVKSYLIDISKHTFERQEKHIFVYTLNIPEGIQYNQVTYGHHAVYFTLDTSEGKYRTQTEPNKAGLMIAKQYDLEVTKCQKNKDKLVSGATYSITEEGQEESRTRVTGVDGKLTLKNIYTDRTYILKEIKSPSEYELNSDEIKFRATEENGQIKVQLISGTVKNISEIQAEGEEPYKVLIEVEDEAKVNLKIVKNEQGTENTIKGVRFKLTGEGLPKNGRILITNASGEINLKGLKIGEEYTLEEVKAEGYYLAIPVKFTVSNDNGTYSVNITEGQTKTNEITEVDSIPTLNLTMENEKIPTYNLQINKVIKGETTPLAGAKFRLFKGTEEIDDYITDENGIITISNLYQYEESKNIDQTYTLKELLAPEGYSAVKDITFKVSKNAEGLLVMDIQDGKIKEQTAGENNAVIITIEDSKSFKLVKTDGETGEVLPNTKFAIYNVDNVTQEVARDSKNNILGTKEIINGKEYYTLTTNEKGEIEADLKEGLYKAIEVKASHNKYDLTNNTYYFGIGAPREADKVMEPKWATTYGENGYGYINSVAATTAGGYIAGGYFTGTIEVGDRTYTNEGGRDGIIIKYSVEDEVEWVETYEGSSTVEINSVAETEDGGVIAAGRFYGAIKVGNETYVGKSGGHDGVVIKYRAEGEVEWVKIMAGNSSNQLSSVAETEDKGVVAGGYFQGTIEVGGNTYTGKGSSDEVIIKYSADGEVKWVRTHGSSSSDKINSVAGTTDGGVIAGGDSGIKKYSADGADVWSNR